jgi:hypothetical protein
MSLLVALSASSAFAYPWMVRHNYGACGACHVDPSGAGQLSPYGRAQSDVLVRWHPTPINPDTYEVSPTINFLWFLEMPEVLNVSGNVRGGGMATFGSSTTLFPLIMATDLNATLNLGRFVVHAQGGAGFEQSEKARVFPRCDPSVAACTTGFVSREYWLGLKLADDAVMIRAGRENLPFGLRNNEHYSWVRSETRTDTNVAQQVGASVAYNSEQLRGELMGIAGNFQTGPDAYRERGYSAFGEYALKKNAYVGLSSLITYAGADVDTALPTVRHAHGAFFRWAPVEMLALMGELDLTVKQSPNTLDKLGHASWLQADFEVVQGLHLMLTGETVSRGNTGEGVGVGGWAGVAWYALPHTEFRLDGIVRRAPAGAMSEAIVAQVHFFL